MIKKMAWNTFKNTGNIDTFLELKQANEIEKNIEAEIYENDKIKGNNNFREKRIGF